MIKTSRVEVSARVQKNNARSVVVGARCFRASFSSARVSALIFQVAAFTLNYIRGRIKRKTTAIKQHQVLRDRNRRDDNPTNCHTAKVIACHYKLRDCGYDVSEFSRTRCYTFGCSFSFKRVIYVEKCV